MGAEHWRWTLNRPVLEPAILDIEASGFGRGSYPIQVGVALPGGATYRFTIRPEPDWKHWDKEAEALHGISRTRLEKEGLPAREVATKLNRLLTGRVIYSDAWGFDNTWLALLFEHTGLVPTFRIEALETLLSPDQLHSWHAIKEQVILETRLTRHKADEDALILQETYMRSANL